MLVKLSENKNFLQVIDCTDIEFKQLQMLVQDRYQRFLEKVSNFLRLNPTQITLHVRAWLNLFQNLDQTVFHRAAQLLISSQLTHLGFRVSSVYLRHLLTNRTHLKWQEGALRHSKFLAILWIKRILMAKITQQ